MCAVTVQQYICLGVCTTVSNCPNSTYLEEEMKSGERFSNARLQIKFDRMFDLHT